MTLEQLFKYFDPFLPTHFGKRLTLPSKSRKREVVELRMMFCFLARSMKYKLGTIGELLGARDHTTVIHNVSTFLNLMETDEQFRSKFQVILNHIKQSHESPDLDESNTSQRLPQPALFS
jgi:chromosomal replication initiator protein